MYVLYGLHFRILVVVFFCKILILVFLIAPLIAVIVASLRLMTT